MTTAVSDTDASSDSTGALRAKLADRLRHDTVHTPAVEAAIRSTPRHLFLPGVPPEAAYADEPVYTKHGGGGASISAASQPRIVAMMLEQLQVEPGHRVLEVGAGTGYNAALMAALTGEAGHVTAVDIDGDLVDGARKHLAAAGVANVDVVLGDGALGHPDAAPYDRIIATVGAFETPTAWLDQLHARPRRPRDPLPRAGRPAHDRTHRRRPATGYRLPAIKFFKQAVTDILTGGKTLEPRPRSQAWIKKFGTVVARPAHLRAPDGRPHGVRPRPDRKRGDPAVGQRHAGRRRPHRLALGGAQPGRVRRHLHRLVPQGTRQGLPGGLDRLHGRRGPHAVTAPPVATFEPRFHERAAQRHLAHPAGGSVSGNVAWGLAGASATRPELDAPWWRDGRAVPA
jgi:protein-L-isoaspartate(D-aspartate) O-methyltransferase